MSDLPLILANLPFDIILKIIKLEQESINNLRMVSTPKDFQFRDWQNILRNHFIDSDSNTFSRRSLHSGTMWCSNISASESSFLRSSRSAFYFTTPDIFCLHAKFDEYRMSIGCWIIVRIMSCKVDPIGQLALPSSWLVHPPIHHKRWVLRTGKIRARPDILERPWGEFYSIRCPATPTWGFSDWFGSRLAKCLNM